MAKKTQAQIATSYTANPFTDDEKSYCRLLCNESLAAIVAAEDSMSGADKKLARYYMDIWADTPDETVAVRGGSDGTDYSQERDRLDACQRMRLLFNLPALATEQLEQIAARVQAYKGKGAPSPFGGSGNTVSSSVSTRAVW